MKHALAPIGKLLPTLAAVALAIVAGHHLWNDYEVAPWTRDGRVKANVVQIAPDVTGQVVSVRVHDNQRVVAGTVLFEIDRARFDLALQQAAAAEQASRVALSQARREARRNRDLRDLVATEVREQGDARVEQAQAAVAQAVANRDAARLNLARTRVVAAVDGFVTNLGLRVGDYVTSGRPVMALVDQNSFYVEGYFEETKLARIHVGDPARISPMGAASALTGHVESFAAGIVDRDRTSDGSLLPNVNPVFNWVRLAQRIPVRVKLDPSPDATGLIAGQTVTVEVRGQVDRSLSAHRAAPHGG